MKYLAQLSIPFGIESSIPFDKLHLTMLLLHIRYIFILILVCILSVQSSSSGLFDSSGRLNNYELSTKATKRGGTVIGVCNSNYTILISYSPHSLASDHSTSASDVARSSRHAKLADNMLVTSVGINSDCNHITQKLFEETSRHIYLFRSNPIGSRVTSSIANYIHQNTLRTHRRWFGVNLCLICTDDVAGPQLYEVDNFGSIHQCKLTCIGELTMPIYLH